MQSRPTRLALQPSNDVVALGLPLPSLDTLTSPEAYWLLQSPGEMPPEVMLIRVPLMNEHTDNLLETYELQPMPSSDAFFNLLLSYRTAPTEGSTDALDELSVCNETFTLSVPFSYVEASAAMGMWLPHTYARLRPGAVPMGYPARGEPISPALQDALFGHFTDQRNADITEVEAASRFPAVPVAMLADAFCELSPEKLAEYQRQPLPFTVPIAAFTKLWIDDMRIFHELRSKSTAQPKTAPYSEEGIGGTVDLSLLALTECAFAIFDSITQQSHTTPDGSTRAAHAENGSVRHTRARSEAEAPMRSSHDIARSICRMPTSSFTSTERARVTIEAIAKVFRPVGSRL